MSEHEDDRKTPRVLCATLDIEGRYDQSLSRRNSTSSAKSWSSGKKYRAPEPPMGSPRSVSPTLQAAVKKKPRAAQKIREKTQIFWSSEKNRRQCYLWCGFFLLLLSFTIAAVIIVRKFTSGFSTSNDFREVEEVDESYLYGQDRAIAQGPSSVQKQTTLGQKVLMLVGGHAVINGNDKIVQVLHGGQGSVCNFPDGFPASIPNPRIGHILEADNEGRHVLMCGGFSPGSNFKQIRKQNTQCFALNLENNEWTRLPPLIIGVSYASSAFFQGELIVIGGFVEGPERAKTDVIQVLDVINSRWRLSAVRYPIKVWGQCTTSTEDGTVSTGGWSDSDPESSLKLTFARQRNKIDSQWRKLTDLNIGRATHACLGTSYKGEKSAIIVAGGMLVDNSPTASVEVFMTSQNAWITLSDMLRPRSWYPSLAILDKKLICVGGKGVSEKTEALEVYHNGMRKWKFSSSTRIEAGRNDARSAILEAENEFLGCIK